MKAIHRPAKMAETQITRDDMALNLIAVDGELPESLAFARRKANTFAKPVATSNTLIRKAGSAT